MLNYRITPMSMLTMAVVSLLIAYALRAHTVSIYQALTSYFTHWGAMTLYIILRGIVIMLVATVPFREHLDEKPSLVLAVLAVSLAASMLALVGFPPPYELAAIVLIFSHGAALYCWWGLVWNDGSIAQAQRH